MRQHFPESLSLLERRHHPAVPEVQYRPEVPERPVNPAHQYLLAVPADLENQYPLERPADQHHPERLYHLVVRCPLEVLVDPLRPGFQLLLVFQCHLEVLPLLARPHPLEHQLNPVVQLRLEAPAYPVGQYRLGVPVRQSYPALPYRPVRLGVLASQLHLERLVDPADPEHQRHLMGRTLPHQISKLGRR